jgi:plasmid stabilization system protein ParE
MGSRQAEAAEPMTLRILSLAINDLIAGRSFYERQGAGLGEYFQDSLLSDIESLLLYPGVHRKVLEYHRLLSKRFPFAIYYKVTGDAVEIWRVLDCRRNPSRHRKALE